MGGRESTLELESKAWSQAIKQYVVSVDSDVVTLEELTIYLVTEAVVESSHSLADCDCHDRVALKLHHNYLPRLADATELTYDPQQRLMRLDGISRCSSQLS